MKKFIFVLFCFVSFSHYSYAAFSHIIKDKELDITVWEGESFSVDIYNQLTGFSSRSISSVRKSSTTMNLPESAFEETKEKHVTTYKYPNSGLYGDHMAVDHLSLTVEPGKIYGLLGPNGAGKSTTMNIVTGYIGADGGTVKINGYDIFAQPEEAKKCIGYLPEIPPLYVDMTVYEYLKFVAELKKLDRKKRKEMIADAMDMTGITEVKNRLIKNLSKGYRQRVGFAQALLGYPEIIILDEPTVGLDPKQIIEIRELIKKLGENHTVILSSHILSEISAVCDHVFIISKGKLVASDATENLINLMSKNQEISLVLKSDEIGARGMLEKIVNVDKVTFEKSEEEKTVKAKVIAKANCDIREEIFELASAMHMPILELHTVVKSLEDVFLELTGEGDEK